MKYKQSIVLMIILFVIIQIWFATNLVKFSYIGADIAKVDGVWTVIRIDPKSSVGLNKGDKIIKVNGSNPDRFISVIRWRTLEKARTIQVQRNQEMIRIDTSSSTKISIYDVMALTGELLTILVAIVLSKWAGYSKSAQYLSFLFLTAGATFMSLVASIRGDLLGKILITTCLALIPIILLHFFSIFFEEKSRIKLPRRYLRYLYFFVLLIPLAYTFSYVFKKITYISYIANYFIVAPYFICGVLLNVILLSYVYIKYRKESGNIATIIKLMWASLVISFAPLVCLSFIPRMLLGHYWVDTFYTSWACLFFPLSFTYLLASKKLYDIDLVIRRFIFTTLISFVPAGFLVGIIAMLFPTEADAGRLSISFLLSVILLSITLYSFEYVTTKLERILFPRKYRLTESLKKIARKLGSITDMRDLKDIILVDIIETLQVFGGAIVFRYPDSEEVISAGNFMVPTAAPGVDWTEDSALTRFEINRNEEYACYLVLTDKKANTQIGFEESQWLKLIISYLSVSLENLHLIRKLTIKMEQLAAHLPKEESSEEFAWFRKLMFELQEKERVRIATDLHDTTMQDLFFLKRRCIALMEQYDNRPEAYNQLSGIVDYIDVINMNLRQSCFELHPYLLKEIGLVQTIQKLVDLEAGTATYKIEFHAGKAWGIENCSMDFKRHLFRMVQELLNNAKKHAKPSCIRLELSLANSRFYLFYEDDGIGFDTNDAISREVGSSRSGMDYLKSRVLSLNGQFEIITSKGNGLRFMADFPLTEGRSAS